MTNPIRAALERLIEALDDYEPVWGGFPESALAAARAALAEQQGEGPTLEEVEELLNRFAAFNIECLQGLINDALARWGRPALVPVAVSERPWEREGWCDDEGRCWCMSSLDGPPPRWWLVRPEPLSDGWVLPAHTLPLPQGEV